MDIEEFIGSLNIDGLTEDMKGQLKFLNDYCEGLDFKDEDIIEAQKKVNETINKLKVK